MCASRQVWTYAVASTLLLTPCSTLAQETAVAEYVSYTASGGSSKGAYQAGVDWLITEFIRRAHNPRFTDTLKLDQPPKLEIASTSGASAGNINALLAAISACTSVPESLEQLKVKPEESLFWKFWVGTGIDELMPERPAVRSAVTDSVFQSAARFYGHADPGWPTPYLRYLLDAVSQRSFRKNCMVPVGLTLTRQTAAHVPAAFSSREFSVQRFAAVFSVATDDDGALAIRPVPKEVLKPSLGALLSPPDGSVCISENDTRGWQWVFDAVVASSAFPIAFEPRQLCGLAGGILKPSELRGRFLDGGAFDNNPVGLGVGLADGRTVPAVIFTSASTLRADLRSRERSGPDVEQGGLPGLLQLLRAGVASAREYEQQIFERQQASAGRRSEVRASHRTGEIFGELLSGFGAFLGRPFRAYDFYAGVYDGIYFVAENYGCGPKRCEEHQARAMARAWIASGVFGLEGEALEVVRWRQLMADNLAHVPPAPPSPITPGSEKRWAEEVRSTTARPGPAPTHEYLAMRRPVVTAVLAQVHRALWNVAVVRQDVANRNCRRRNDPAGALLCAGGFDDIVKGLAEADRTIAMSEALVRSSDFACEPECFVDEAFVRLLRKQAIQINRLLDSGIRRLLDLESARSSANHQTDLSGRVRMFAAWRGGSTFRYRSLFSVNPSSGQGEWSHPVASALTALIPNYLVIGREAAEASEQQLSFGWRPLVVRPSQTFYLGTVWELHNLEDRSLDGKAWTGGVTLGTHSLPIPATTVEAGVFRMKYPYREISTLGGLSIRLVQDKLFLDVRTKIVGQGKFKEWYAGGGLSDLNGMLYWLIRGR